MTRDNLVELRDKLFGRILDTTRCPVPIGDWSMDDRISLTTMHMQYQAVVCQLRELKEDGKHAEALVALDECRSTIGDILHRDGLGDKLDQLALRQITHALTLLGV